MACIRSNIDIKFIPTGKDCRALAFYMTDYQTKSNLSSHNVLPLILSAFKKMELGRDNQDYSDAIMKAKQMVVKCLNRIGTETEVSASHVAYYLLGNDDKITSDTFRYLDLHSMLQWANQQLEESSNDNHSEDTTTIEAVEVDEMNGAFNTRTVYSVFSKNQWWK